MDNVGENLYHINMTLERQNDIIQQMLDIMPKPVSKLTSMLETAVLIASVFGLVTVADVVIKWVKGG